MNLRVNATTHAWKMIRNLTVEKAFLVASEFSRPYFQPTKDVKIVRPKSSWSFWNTVRNICIKELQRLNRWPLDGSAQNTQEPIATPGAVDAQV